MDNSTFNILSFDGGGIRGILSVNLLQKIQNEIPNIIKTCKYYKWNINRQLNSIRISIWNKS